MECYIPSTHSTRIADTIEFISTVIPIPKKISDNYLRQSITYTISLLEDPNPTVPYFSFRDDAQNSVKKIATILNRAIHAPNPIKTTITPISPQPTSPSVLTTQSPVLAPHPALVLRVVSDTASVPMVTVPEQPSPQKSAHKKTPYILRSSTKQSRSPNSRYIHPSRYPTHSTALAQLLIKEYDHHIAHLYHPVTGAKEIYDSLYTQAFVTAA